MENPGFWLNGTFFFSLTVFSLGWLLRYLKWSRFAKAENVFPRVKNPKKTILEALTIDLLPMKEYSAQLDPIFYLIGLSMHLAFFFLFPLYLIKYLEILGFISSTDSFFSGFMGTSLKNLYFGLLKDVLLAVLTISLSIMYARKFLLSKVKEISGLGDFLAIPFLLIIAVLGYLSMTWEAVYSEPYFFLTSIFMAYVPYSKFSHFLTFFIVRAYRGLRKSIYGV